MESQLGRFREYDRDAEGGAETPGYDPSARIGPRFKYNRLVRLVMMAHTKKEARVVGERRCGGARGRRDDQRAAAETGRECLSDECTSASLGDDDSASKGSRCQEGTAHAAAEGAVTEFPAAESVLLAARELRSQCGKSPFWCVEGFIPSADAHLQMSLGGTKNHTDSQKVVLEMMPTLSSKQPVHGSHKTVRIVPIFDSQEWMKLRRRGEELREQFASDFDALYKTYLAEIERIDGEMKKIEDST